MFYFGNIGVFQGDLSPLSSRDLGNWILCDASVTLWLRNLDPDSCTDWEIREVSGWAGKEGGEVTKTSLQHRSYYYTWCSYYEKQGFGEEVRVPEEGNG